MRIALLSATGNAPGGGASNPAFASFAGAMLIEHQLDLAVRLGCEQIACLVDKVEREIVELQHRAERAGVKFRPLRQHLAVMDMVDEDDELLVIAAGLLPDTAVVEQGLQRGSVLALPAELAVPVGYERIDLEMAWAGILLAPGKTVAGLSQLPTDVDIPSSLMRLSLQSGGRTVMLDRELLGRGDWLLDPDRKALDDRERRWIETQREDIAFRAPGLAVAERAGARLARDVVGRAAEPVPIAAAAVCGVGGVAAAIFGYPSQGIVLVTLSALFGHMAGVVERVAQLGKPGKRKFHLERWIANLLDPLFIVLLVLASPEELGFLRAFAPLMLFGLLRLGARHSSEEWRRTYDDRILLGAVLSPFAFAGFATEIAAVLALIVLGSRFFRPFRSD